MKLNINKVRILLASIIGGTYAVISFMSILEEYSSITLKVALSISMVYLSFYPKNVKILFKQLLIFYLTSFTFGGVAFALLYILKPQDILMKNGLLLGIKSDYIILTEQNRINDVIIGIYEKSLTKSGNYTALIGLDILERSDENKYIANIKS